MSHSSPEDLLAGPMSFLSPGSDFREFTEHRLADGGVAGLREFFRKWHRELTRYLSPNQQKWQSKNEEGFQEPAPQPQNPIYQPGLAQFADSGVLFVAPSHPSARGAVVPFVHGFQLTGMDASTSEERKSSVFEFVANLGRLLNKYVEGAKEGAKLAVAGQTAILFLFRKTHLFELFFHLTDYSEQSGNDARKRPVPPSMDEVGNAIVDKFNQSFRGDPAAVLQPVIRTLDYRGPEINKRQMAITLAGVLASVPSIEGVVASAAGAARLELRVELDSECHTLRRPEDLPAGFHNPVYPVLFLS